MQHRWVALALGLVLAGATTASAILIDPYDNILAPDGVYGLAYGEYYHASQFTDGQGNELGDGSLTVSVAIVRPLAYFHLGPVPLAFQVIVPFGRIEGDLSIGGTEIFDDSSAGLGDIIFGPGVFLYTNTASNTYLSYWFYAFTPTGAWDKDQAINLGTHHWYFEHQLAYNQLLGKFVYDMNLNYYHHSEEPDQDYTAPARFELETSLAYQVTEKLILGVNGGGYWDLDEGEVNGAAVDNTRLKRVQLGPTAGYQITPQLGVNLRWTYDISSANDTKGTDVWLRAAYAF